MNEIKYIWLNGMPRSGTSWLSQIFDSSPDVKFRLSPLFSYAFKNAVNKDSTKQEWISFFTKVYYSDDNFLNQTYRRITGEYPVFKLKNEPQRFLVIKDTRYHNLTERIINLFPEIKFIHIVRNPCAAINSWLKSPKEFPHNAEPDKEWRTGACRKTGPEESWGFNDWKLLTNSYLDLAAKMNRRIMLVRYEELVNGSLKLTKKMFEFVGLKTQLQTINFLNDCHSKNMSSEYAVYKDKNVKDKWKKQLDKNIIDEIYDELRGTRLERFLYD